MVDPSFGKLPRTMRLRFTPSRDRAGRESGSEGQLEPTGCRCYLIGMSHGMVLRLRSLALLLAFGIGLLGQTVAAVAMPMAMLMPQDAAASSASATHAGACPLCPQRDTPAAPTAIPRCPSPFCSVLPAVLPAGPTIVHAAPAAFQAIAQHAGPGITIRPDLGPPRPIHHS